jgi:integrase
MSPQWRNPKHVAQWKMTLREYAGPIRHIGLENISTEDVLRVLKPIWTAKSETASRVRGRVEAVLNWASAKKLRSGENPARWRGHLDQLLPKRQRLSRGHHAAMATDDLPDFMETLTASSSVSPRGLEFLILTVARTSEVIGLRWPEIDFERRLWTVPAERMKAAREHRVPLSDHALAILSDMAAARCSEFVFPGEKPGRPLSIMAFDMTLRRMGVSATVHGFRSTFRDWASERTSFPHEVCEMALAFPAGAVDAGDETKAHRVIAR